MKILALLLGFAITLAAQTPIKAPLLFEEQTAPGSPAANTASLYSKDSAGTTKICMKDSAGTETCIGSGGGGDCDLADPNIVCLREEWMAGKGDIGAGQDNGELGWANICCTGGVQSFPNGEANHPGIARHTTGTTDDQYEGWYLTPAQNTSTIARIDNITFDSKWIVRLNSCSGVAIRLGFLTGNINSGDADAGVYVDYDTDLSDSNWYLAAYNGGTTRNDSSVACSTGWNTFRLYSTVAGTIRLDINGTYAVDTTGLTLPTTAVGPKLIIQNRDTTDVSIDFDYFWLRLPVSR